MPDEPKEEAHTATVDLVGMTLLLFLTLGLRSDRIGLTKWGPKEGFNMIEYLLNDLCILSPLIGYWFRYYA